MFPATVLDPRSARLLSDHALRKREINMEELKKSFKIGRLRKRKSIYLRVAETEKRRSRPSLIMWSLHEDVRVSKSVASPIRTMRVFFSFKVKRLYRWLLSRGAYSRLMTDRCLYLVIGNRSFMRTLFCLPMRGQKTRSNAKTARTQRIPDIVFLSRYFDLTRVSAGQSFGENAKKKKQQAKLQAQALIRNRNKAKKNKPVVRSRDSKKSVWA